MNRDRFIRDPLKIRLGNLAANLARIRSFSQNEANQQAVLELMKESRYFIEWTVKAAGNADRGLLCSLMRRLTRWIGAQPYWWKQEKSRRTLAEEALVWSKRILNQSGII